MFCKYNFKCEKHDLKTWFKKNQNYVVLAHLTVVDNWDLTEYQINNNWKLEYWNDKTES